MVQEFTEEAAHLQQLHALRVPVIWPAPPFMSRWCDLEFRGLRCRMWGLGPKYRPLQQREPYRPCLAQLEVHIGPYRTYLNPIIRPESTSHVLFTIPINPIVLVSLLLFRCSHVSLNPKTYPTCDIAANCFRLELFGINANLLGIVKGFSQVRLSLLVVSRGLKA